MISVQEALQIILDDSQYFGTEQVSFVDSQNKILKENIYADRDFPPFNRVSMDGIAITEQAFLEGKRSFLIEGIQAAGSKKMTLKNQYNCIEVMTGAVLPENANIVIPYELVEIIDTTASVKIESATYFQNIHKKGKDKEKGDLLISENTIMTAAEIGVLATVGKSEVTVAKLPKVMIVSTGDELVAVHENPLAHQIRRSNVHSLVSLLKEKGLAAETAHLPDDKPALLDKIQKLVEAYDVLMFSGAVSKGKYDYIPEVLEELGVKKRFHKVKQRPGKPFWYGNRHVETKGGGENHTTIFAFPGNPVSTYVNCMKYFYPWLQKSLGIEITNQSVFLAEDFVFKPMLTYFLQVKVVNENGVLKAFPVTGNGSGDLANLVQADGFIELPDNRIEFKKGEVFDLLSYR